MLKIMWKILSPLLSVWGIEINPTTLEWVEHYVKGSQSPKTLPQHLIGYTKRHIILDLDYYFSAATLRGVASCYPEEGYESSDWYRHPTAGVVGGFSYELVSWQDKFIFECYDTWDFNFSTEEGEGYVIPLPKNVDVATLRKILKRFGVPLSKGVYELGISEEWLCRFNDKHAFKTTWTVEIEEPLSCPLPIYRPSVEIILKKVSSQNFSYLKHKIRWAYNSEYGKTRILLERGVSLWFLEPKCGSAMLVAKTKQQQDHYSPLLGCFE